MSKSVIVRCPDCRKGFETLTDLFRHAKQTKCDVSSLERQIFDVALRRSLAARNDALRRMIT